MLEIDGLQVHLMDSVTVAVRLRAPHHGGVVERFDSSDPFPGLDVARNPRIARILRNRKFKFMLILSNQIIFWTVIFVGLMGAATLDLNFGAAITWYVWFFLVFVMMIVVGRTWCAMCSFGGFAEWIQRHTFWQRAQTTFSLGREVPTPLAQLGFVLTIGTFLLLTWIEEYFIIARLGNRESTSFMVITIAISALAFFLVFERRTFRRYVCPLTSLIGTVGSMGTITGFRKRDRDVYVSCKTQDYISGGDQGFGYP